MSASGAYWLFVQVDVYNYIIESSKANNLSAALPGSFTLVPPDLAPVSLSAPASAPWGSSVPISCVVTNQGSGGISNYWADGIYYSTNSVFGSGRDAYWRMWLRTMPWRRGAVTPGPT